MLTRLLLTFLLMVNVLDVTTLARQEDRSSVVEILEVLSDYWALPELINRLAAELSDGIGSREEKQQRLEARLRDLLAEPELGRRLDIVRFSGIEHGWSIGFSDLEGSTFSAPVTSIQSAVRAQINTRRKVVRDFEVTSRSLASVFDRYPIRNIEQKRDVERQVESQPSRVLTLAVVSLDRVTVEFVRERGRWKVSDTTSDPEFAWTFISE